MRFIEVRCRIRLADEEITFEDDDEAGESGYSGEEEDSEAAADRKKYGLPQEIAFADGTRFQTRTATVPQKSHFTKAVRYAGREQIGSESMSRIKLNELDHSFKDSIAAQPGGEGIRACFACKTCTSACPIEAIDKRYDPVKILRMALLGMKKEVLESDFIWLCSSCYGCQEVCPQNVRFTEVMFAIKNLAVVEACVPPGLSTQKALLKAHGRLYEVTDFENEKREKLGLPPIVEHPEDYAKLLEE